MIKIPVSLMPLFIFFSVAVQGQDILPEGIPKPLIHFDDKKPLFKLEDEQFDNKNRLFRFSALTGYREGVEPVKGITNFNNYQDVHHGTGRIYMYNLSIEDMLSHGLYPEDRVILEVKNPARFRYNADQGSRLEWMRKNAYCYELLLPAGGQGIVQLMNAELSRFFGVKFGPEKRILDVFVLVRTSAKDKIGYKGKEESSVHDQRPGVIHNEPIENLSIAAKSVISKPMLNETDYVGNVDIYLSAAALKNIESLRAGLQKYDLDLKEVKRELTVFVITEVN